MKTNISTVANEDKGQPQLTSEQSVSLRRDQDGITWSEQEANKTEHVSKKLVMSCCSCVLPLTLLSNKNRCQVFVAFKFSP